MTFKISTLFLSFILLAHFTFVYSRNRYPHNPFSQVNDDGNAFLNHNLNPSIFHQFGTFSARFSVQPSGPLFPPKQCKIVQVISLERHGSRHLSKGAFKSANQTLANIQKSIQQSSQNINKLPKLIQFLVNAKIDTTVEDLMPFGALQAWYSGKSTASVYKQLAMNGGAFIRSSGNDVIGQDRLLLTSKYWRLGFEGEPFPAGEMSNSNQVRTLSQSIKPADVIIAENSATNDTLSPSTCPADQKAKPANISSDAMQAAYTNSTLLPIIGTRLQNYFQKHKIILNINQSTISDLANLCLFETFSRAQINQQGRSLDMPQSQFCQLFEGEHDWKMLGYFMDLGMYYQAGYGNPYHKALGTGFLRELLARLTNTAPVLNPPTSLNTTLDAANSTTFPIENNKIYMDTSHDGTMASIASSIGLKRSPFKLTPGKHTENKPHNWKFAEIAPMQGKIVFEKLHCNHDKHPNTKEYVRIRMNDQTQIPDQFWCPDSSEKDRKQNICPLAKFKKHLEFVQSDAEWNKCYQ